VHFCGGQEALSDCVLSAAAHCGNSASDYAVYKQLPVGHGSALSPLIGIDQELISFDPVVTQGLLRASSCNAIFMVMSRAQPNSRRLYRSIQTPKYSQLGMVLIRVLSPAQLRLVAALLYSSFSKLSATLWGRGDPLRQGLISLLVLAFRSATCMTRATR